MHILIVEDDADNARVLELALRVSRHGNFTCSRVPTLAAALERLSTQTFDVVLLDLTLPDSRGLETLARIRARFRQTPVVVITGMTDQAVAVRALHEGAQDYLIKGQVDSEAVARSVRYVIERTRAEREHEATRVRLELAADSVQLGIWELDLRTDRLIWSRAMAEIFGIEELEGTADVFQQFIHPDDRIDRAAAIDRAMAAHDLYRREVRIVRPDGTIRWVESRGRGIYDESGRAIRMIGTILDITVRKQAEQAAREREATLAHLARVSLVGQMAAGLAHEINQPLGAILNYSAVGLTQLDATPPVVEGPKAALKNVMDEARRAGQIIRRIREFLAKQEPTLVPIDLNQTVQGALALMRFELERAGIRPNLRLADSLPPVLADAVQVEQVLVNLVYNALDAMQTVAPNERSLTIRTELEPAKSGKARVSVTDSGVGIPATVAQRLFEPFYTTKTNGLGMGLNLSRTIVERMGGIIGPVPVAPGTRGSCFTFTLPITSTQSSGVEPAATSATFPATTASPGNAPAVQPQQRQGIAEISA